eukprot:COSAG02_NODE_2162_length_9623_cov_3.592923_7_plen_63_part_00
MCGRKQPAEDLRCEFGARLPLPHCSSGTRGPSAELTTVFHLIDPAAGIHAILDIHGECHNGV